jgi:uncharacterized protein (DUF2147 family)
MKSKIIITLFFFATITNNTKAQSLSGNEIIGIWQPQDKSILVSIYEVNSKYNAKVRDYLGNRITKKDVNNPDVKLRNLYVSDVMIIRDMVFDGDSWTGGEIYDPSKGEIYSCKIEMVDLNTIKVTGYKILSIFWKHEVWRRIQ